MRRTGDSHLKISQNRSKLIMLKTSPFNPPPPTLNAKKKCRGMFETQKSENKTLTTNMKLHGFENKGQSHFR